MDDRERDKVTMMKDDTELIAGSKRRKLKREHMSSETVGEYSQAGQLPPSLAPGMPQLYDGRERADKKAVMGQQRAVYIEEAPRIHGKEAAGKMNRRESDQYPYAYLYAFNYISSPICNILFRSNLVLSQLTYRFYLYM